MLRFTIIAALALLGWTPLAGAQDIYTGDPTGAYYSNFCPPLSQELGHAYYNTKCTTSAGTVENMTKVLAKPQSIGFGQFDVVALMATQNPEVEKKIAIVRDDIAHECLFVISNNPRLVSIDDISNFASRIPFILPAKNSGSAATFALLQNHDPEGLGRATNVTYAASVNDMVSQVLSNPIAVGMFVQLPDPTNAVFKTIADKKGRFISALNKRMLDIKVADHAVYKPVETPVQGISVLHSTGGNLTTSCTPVVVFTGKPEDFPDGSNDRKNQADLIKVISDLDRTKLLPGEGGSDAARVWSWLTRKTSTLSAQGLDAFNRATEAARQKVHDMTTD